MNQRTILPLLTLLITVALAGMLPGCGNLSAIPAPSPEKEQSPPPAASQREKKEEEEALRLAVADAPRYRGTVAEMTPWGSDGQLLVLEAAPGTGQEARLSLALTPDSRTSFDRAELAVGDHLEVYYSQLPPGSEGPAAIIAANRLLPADMVYYNGILVSVSSTDQGRRLLLQNLDTPEDAQEGDLYLYQTIFWVGEEAHLYLTEDQLVPGAALNIFHRGIYTMSLPPQGIALEVRLMVMDT